MTKVKTILDQFNIPKEMRCPEKATKMINDGITMNGQQVI